MLTERPERPVPPEYQVDVTPDPGFEEAANKLSQVDVSWVKTENRPSRIEPTLPVKIFGWTLVTIIFVVVILAVLAGAIKIVELLWVWIH